MTAFRYSAARTTVSCMRARIGRQLYINVMSTFLALRIQVAGVDIEESDCVCVKAENSDESTK